MISNDQGIYELTHKFFYSFFKVDIQNQVIVISLVTIY